MTALHKIGEPCPVVDLMYARFGEIDGHELLLGATCFPCDDETALKQAKELVRKADAGMSVRDLLNAAADELDAAMARLERTEPGDTL